MTDWLVRLLAPGSDKFNRVELLWRAVGRLPLAALLLLLAGAVVVSALALRRAAGAPRAALIVLRSLAALVLLLIVLGPALELQQATRIPSRVAVLIDTSRSMALKVGDATRIETARQLAAGTARALAASFAVELHAFDSGMRRVDPKSLGGLGAEGARTDLAGALAALKAGNEDGALVGAILITDGVDTERLKTAADVERRRGDWPEVPVFPVLVADPSAFRDLALVDLRFEPLGFVRHELSFDVKLLARGFDRRQVEVTLKQDGSPLTTRSVAVRGDRQVEPLSFRITPDRPGTFLYSIEAQPLPEETVLVNNRAEFAVTVARDQVRVLLICGRPSWDERFLRQTLKKDPNVDLVSFFILRDEGDDPGVPQDELSLIPFPVHDLFTSELANFDVVILQNFNRSFSRGLTLSTLHLDNLREFVVNKGGGLMLVGGDLGMRSGGYTGSPLEEILPFALGAGGPEADESSFTPRLTEAGSTHFVTALEPDPAETRARFASLPALDGTNVVGPLAPGASALLVHPRLGAGGEPMPVLAARQVGKGRTLGLTVDSTWYWGFKVVGRGGSNRDYLRFWQNALRWLSQDPSSKFLNLTIGAETVEPGKTEPIKVRALKGDYAPLASGRIRAVVEPAERRGAGEAAAPAERFDGLTDADGTYRFETAPKQEGFYRVRAELTGPSGAAIDRDSKLFEVRSDRTELEDPGLNLEVVEAIARATGGRVLDAGDLSRPPIPDRAIYRLAERKRLELWDNPLVYAVLIALLAAEWWLRRRAGLL